MDEQNKVLLDTSQAKQALAELQSRLLTLDKTMDGLSAGKLMDEYKRLKAGSNELEVALKKIESAKGTSVSSMRRYRQELSSILTQLSQYKSALSGVEKLLVSQGAAVNGAKAASVSYRAVIDGISYSVREAGRYSQEYIKQIAVQQSAEKATRSAGVTQYRAVLENEARDRRLGLQQLLAASMEEARTRRLGLQQVQAAKEDERITRSAGVTQYRAVLENEARDRRLGLAQVAAAREEELRNEQAAIARQSKMRADALFRRLDDIKKAKQAEQAALALEAGRSAASVTKQYGSLATSMGASMGSTALAAEVDRLTAAKARLASATAQSAAATGKWSAVQWEARSAARGLAGALGQLWMTYGQLTTLLAGAAVGAATKSAVTLGSEFEYQLTFVKALGDVASESMSKLSASAKELSSNGMFGPVEVANGLRTLAQAGLDAEKAIATLPHVLDLATVGEMKMEDAAITLVGVMTAFGKTALDTGSIGDMFAKAAAESQIAVSDMTEAMRTASVVGEQYGASMEDTATALTLLGQVNIKGSAAGTSLRNMLKELYTPMDRAAKQMRELGLQTTDAEGKLRSFPDIIYDLKSILEQFDAGSQSNILQNLFGERGAKEAIVMLSKTREEYDRLKDSIAGSAGFMREVAAQLEATTKGSMKQAVNALQVSLMDAYESTDGAVGEIAQQLKSMFESDEFREALKFIVVSVAELVKALVSLAPVIATAATGWLAFKAAIAATSALASTAAGVTRVAGSLAAMSGAMGPAVAGGVGVTAMIRGLGVAFAATTGPIGLAVAGLTAFSMWIYQSAQSPFDALVRDTDRLANSMQGLYEKTKAANDSLLKQMRAKGLATSTETEEARLTMENARLELDKAKKQRDERASRFASVSTLMDSPVNALRELVGIGKDAWNINEAEDSVTRAEDFYRKSESEYQLRRDREDALKLHDQIESQREQSRISTGERNLQGEEFIRAGSKASDPLGAELKALESQYEAVKRTYHDKPAELAAAKDSYDAQVKAILEKDAKTRGVSKVDRTPLFETRDARKIAESEYAAAKTFIDFDKKVLELRRQAGEVGEADYQKQLDQIADQEIQLAIAREKRVQDEISQHLSSVKDTGVRSQLLTMRQESINKQAELENEAVLNSELNKLREVYRQKDFLKDIERLEAESYSNRLTAQEEFIRDWKINYQTLMDKALADGNIEAVIRIGNAKESGLRDAEKTDRGSLLSVAPDDVELRREQLALIYQEDMDLIKRITLEGTDERNRLERERTAKHNQDLLKLRLEGVQGFMTAGEQLTSAMAGLLANTAGEQSKAYRVMFAASKAFAIAQATLSFNVALGKAIELGWPVSMAAMVEVMSTGANLINQISSVSYAGAYDRGGSIPGGKWGIVGEYGPEIVQGPATVTSRARTAQLLEEAAASKGQAVQQAAPQVNIKQINAFDTGVINDYMTTEEGQQLVLNIVKRNPEAMRAVVGG